MNKENNKSAAGRRPSAVKARLNLQEEWSALKGTDSNKGTLKSTANVLKGLKGNVPKSPPKKESTRNMQLTNDVLRGVVALVDTGSETRALPLRAALSALGASVLPSWSPLVTHLVWTQGGSRSTRAKARALACRLVSPLWVEACAAASKRLPERGFPAVTRPSDLPSPTTLRRMLKKVEMENINITDLLSDSDDAQKLPRLRISTDSEHDTTNSTDTSHDTSNDTSRDKTKETTADVESRVNTAPRRALPKISESLSPIQPKKSRRKLFTHKEGEMDGHESDETTMPPNKPVIKKPSQSKPKQTQSKPKQTQSKPKQQTQSKQTQPKLTQSSRKQLARAERIARKILTGCTQDLNSTKNTGSRPRIVLTGMSRIERQSCIESIKSLKGRLQNSVDKFTTHVVMGSCGMDRSVNTVSLCHKPRTYNALSGAARGCRIVNINWLSDCLQHNSWLSHVAYEIGHLKKISQKARAERTALCKSRCEYAYDIFYDIRIRLSDERLYAAQLLSLCGATVYTDTEMIQNAGQTQNGGRHNHKIQKYNGQEYDIKVGSKEGDINPKWIFDSVAAGRMRTARRYVVKENSFNCQMATLGTMC